MTTTLDPPRGDLAEATVRDRAWFLYPPFLLAVVLTFGHTTDDALITLRYAANLVHGHGAVFNVGEHVQGFSSPLGLLVACIVVLVPWLPTLLVAKLVSLGFGLLAVREGARLVELSAVPTWSRRIGFVLIGSSFVVAMSAANGLETSLAMWLVVLLVRRLVEGSAVTDAARAGVVAAALAIARPESAAMLAALGVVALLLERSVAWPRRITWLLGAVAALVVTALVGIVYYGAALPNTYDAKHQPISRAVGAGVDYLAHAVAPNVILALFVLTFFAVGVGVVLTRVQRFGYAAAVVAAQCLFVVESGGDWMHGGRFLAPVVIPGIAVIVVGVGWCGREIGRRSPTLRTGAAVVGSLIAAALVVTPYVSGAVPVWRSHGHFTDAALVRSGGYAEWSGLWAALPALAACVPSGGTVATTEVGNLGYARRDLRVLDLRGLTDAPIATRSPATAKWPWGVETSDWSDPASVLGRRLLEVRPDEIALMATAGRFPPVALGGAYRRVGFVTVDAPDRAVVYVPVDAGPACDHVTQRPS